MLQKLTRFLWNEDGPTAVEYAVMLALIIAMCIAAIALAGGPVTAFWNDSSNEIGNAVSN